LLYTIEKEKGRVGRGEKTRKKGNKTIVRKQNSRRKTAKKSRPEEGHHKKALPASCHGKKSAVFKKYLR